MNHQTSCVLSCNLCGPYPSYPALMVKYLKLYQDFCYTVIVPDNSFGVWCGENSRMLSRSGKKRYFKKLHFTITSKALPTVPLPVEKDP